ncbi:hypothetical protein COJ90_21200 [Priestia megaterium]|uniref:conjugal transfer protein TrbL family protein n=1 Tax=Priestia megaterium TaxID=1404 RepID=UPI000BF2EBCB|nr:conjugal transfer protein TrbL family protein [Priestia megaterium]PFP09233.1 hypothetical protein COJ90_21200 [Priestia megaterium]
MKNLASFVRIALCLTVLILLQSSLNLHPSFAEEDNNKQSLIDPTIDEKQFEKDLKQQVENTPTQSRKIEKGKGKFYDAYKKEIDKLAKQYEKLYGEGAADSYKDRVKDLDYQAGNFDCGTFDVSCKIDSWFFSIGKQATEYALSPLSKLAIKPSEVLDDTVLTKFKNSFGTLPQALLSLVLIYQILKMLVVRFTDMSDAPQVLNEKLVKTVIAALLLFAYTPFFKLLLNLQYALNAPIFYQLTGSGTLKTDITISFLLAPNGAMMIIFLIVYALVILALFLQMVYSFCLIAVLFVVGPLAIVTIPNDEYNFFNLWLKIYASRALTMFVQGLCVVLSISFLTNFDNVLELSKQPFVFAAAIGFLIVGITAPTLLQNFGSSSGSGRMIISTVKTIARRG